MWRFVPRRIVTLGVLSMLFASLVAAGAYNEVSTKFAILCSDQVISGARNFDQALLVALLAGLAGPVFAIAVFKWRLLLAAVLLLDAATLIVAVVMLGNPTYVADRFCGIYEGSTTRIVFHASHFDVLWGLCVVVLLLQAYRAWGEARRSSPSEPLEPTPTSNH